MIIYPEDHKITRLEEHLINRYYEMAETDLEIRYNLSRSAELIIQHLYKIYYMPLSNNRHHWITEIYAFLPAVHKRKSTKKISHKGLHT